MSLTKHQADAQITKERKYQLPKRQHLVSLFEHHYFNNIGLMHDIVEYATYSSLAMKIRHHVEN